MIQMKRIFLVFIAIVMATASLWSKDDEVIVTRQLLMSQRKSLPDKTIVVETKRLVTNKKANPELLDALQQLMDTIAREDYMNRTFVLFIEPNANGEITISAQSDDIVTRGKLDASIYYGTVEHERYHFVVLTGKDNMPLLDQTFKRQGKVKFVQEFEFVDFKTPNYPTVVTGKWAPDNGFKWQTVVINEEPDTDPDSPAHNRE